MRYAIVTSGGKQYVAREGETLEVDRLGQPEGETFEFSEVLLAAEGDQVLVGAPKVDGARVRATVLGEIRAKKVVVFRYQPKKRRRRMLGHRQTYSRLRIDQIDLPGVERKDSAKAEEPKAAPRKKTAAKAKAAAGTTKSAGRKSAGGAKSGAKTTKKKGS
ncbi:MAG TPA: 50S ribosomal protein L21 [Anaerolineales bacterium]|nr:50S ribosomal protein L21 [Anaerolineales bacterium]